MTSGTVAERIGVGIAGVAGLATLPVRLGNQVLRGVLGSVPRPEPAPTLGEKLDLERLTLRLSALGGDLLSAADRAAETGRHP